MPDLNPRMSDGSVDVQIAALVRSLDDQLGTVDLSASGHHRIRERLSREAARYEPPRMSGRAVGSLAFFGGLATAAMVLFVAEPDGLFDRDTAVVDAEAVVNVDGFQLLSTGCAVERDGDAVEVGRDCHLRLDDLGVDVRVLDSSTLVAAADGVHVRSGWVVFEVETVQPGESPVSVHVPAGRIDVLGTQFVVHVEPQRGQVELREGRIAFEDLAGETSAIVPGQRVAWQSRSSGEGPAWVAVVDPPADVVVAGPVTDGTAATDERSSRDDAASVPQSHRSSRKAGSPADHSNWEEALEDVQRLRAVRRYRAALRKLEQVRRQVRDPKAQEVLGYEAGTLLEASGDRQHACKHWRQYLRKYPDSRYRENVAQRLDELGCP